MEEEADVAARYTALIPVLVTPAVRDQLDDEAEEQGVSRGELVRGYIDAALPKK